MYNIIKKFTSRKFLATAATTAAGIGTALSTAADPEIRIVGLIVAAVSTIMYNVIEGNIDAKSVAATAKEALEGITEALEEQEKE